MVGAGFERGIQVSEIINSVGAQRRRASTESNSNKIKLVGHKEHPMRAVDIIIKKRDKGELTREEIEFFIKGFVS